MEKFTNCFVRVRFGIFCIKIYLFIFGRLKTCFYKYDNIIVMSRLDMEWYTANLPRNKSWKFWNRTCLIIGLTKNSSKIKKWWSKFLKNVTLKKTTPTNKQKQQSNCIGHADLAWCRIIRARHGPRSQFHITTFDVW